MKKKFLNTFIMFALVFCICLCWILLQTEVVSQAESNVDVTDNGDSTAIVSDDIMASGSYKNVTWTIDSNGKLTVNGTGEFSSSTDYDRTPWYSYRESITTAEIVLSEINNLSYMFWECSNLTDIDLSQLDTSSATNMICMFSGCSSLSEIDLSNFNTCNVKFFDKMFENCSSLESLDLSNFDTSMCLETISMFYNCSSLKSLDISNFNTQNVVYMSYMFNGCSSLENLDLSSFNTQNVVYMNCMFYGCSSLTSLNLSNFNTSNVEYMDFMFADCSSLESLDLSNFDTSAVGINTPSDTVEGMSHMFEGCSSLKTLDISSFDTSYVTGMHNMFEGCSSLKQLDLSHFDTSKVKYVEGMFEGCTSLEYLDISSFDTLLMYSFDQIGQIGVKTCENLMVLKAPAYLYEEIELPSIEGYYWAADDGNECTAAAAGLSSEMAYRRYADGSSTPLMPEVDTTDPNMAFVESMTANSLINADDTTRTSINNAIYNLLFKAQWRPNKNNVNDVDFGSYSDTLSQKQVNASWKNRNNQSNVYSVTDEGLGGTYKIYPGARGCLEYARFIQSYVYGVSGEGQLIEIESVTSIEELIEKIHKYADPGEHIRIEGHHSVVFLGEDDEGTGFYCVDYGDDNGTDPNITLRHYTYTDFVNDSQWKGASFTIWDTNGGSYSAGTASDIATVRTKNGVTAAVTKLDCPVEAVVTLNGESLSSIGLEDGDTVSTSFGSMQREGESIIFKLDYSNDYEFEIFGTGEGTMTLTLMYYVGDDVIDTRKIVDVPITENTYITTSEFDPCSDFVLYIDDDDELQTWGVGTNGVVYSENSIYDLSGDCEICMADTGDDHTHVYNSPEFTWSEDYSVCTATFTCVDGDDTQTVECTVSYETTAASFGVEGKTVYTAICTFQDVEYSDVKEVTIAALEDDTQVEHTHTYNEPEFTWSEDYSTCTATFTCVDGDDSQIVECTVSSETTAASIGVEGKIVYTATYTFQDVEYIDTKEVTIAALENETSSTNDSSQENEDESETSESSDGNADVSSDSGASSSSETDPVAAEDPSTGDEANLLLWGILIVAACTGMCTLVYVNRKKNR